MRVLLEERIEIEVEIIGPILKLLHHASNLYDTDRQKSPATFYPWTYWDGMYVVH